LVIIVGTVSVAMMMAVVVVVVVVVPTGAVGKTAENPGSIGYDVMNTDILS
jgi:hypothetical protein